MFSVFSRSLSFLSLFVFVCVLQDRIHIENGALTVASVNLSDAGMYQCVAENKHGIIYFSAELVVLGKTVLPFFVFSPDPIIFGSLLYHHKLLCIMDLKYVMVFGNVHLYACVIFMGKTFK